MNKQEKKRLCWNCEGSVPTQAETCQYCGVTVVPASLDGSNHPFTPLYQPSAQQQITPPSHYKEHISEDHVTNSVQPESEASDSSFLEFKHVLWAVSLLLSGSVFLLFGITLGIFSHDGVLTLQWNADIWMLYLFAALPLLFFGWRSWSKLE